MQKALREAKLATSWTAPDLEYERTVADVIDGLAADQAFQADLSEFVAPLVRAGRINSLSQTLLKLTSPGIPDIYQGCEGWNLTLVDPDNRRVVDFEQMSSLLDDSEIRYTHSGAAGVLEGWDEGIAKMFLTQRTLTTRREHPEAFGSASEYRPLHALGPQAQHLVAFERGQQLITLVPRLVIGLAQSGGWGSTTLELPPGLWIDTLSGRTWSGTQSLRGILGSFPVALLISAASSR
jgi:(1->4)-alpha-D-glucan 1-alpha-D-glucosylmutase